MSSSQKFIRKPVGDGLRDQQNPFFPKEQVSLWQRFRFYFLIFFILLSGVVYWVLFSPYFRIQELIISGNERLTNTELTQTFREFQLQKKWKIFPQNHWIFFSASSFKIFLNERYILDSATITKEYPQTILLNLKERIPGITLQEDSQLFYTDRNGIITEEVSGLDPDPRFPRVVDLRDTDFTPGQRAMPQDLAALLLTIVEHYPSDHLFAFQQAEIPQQSCSRPQKQPGVLEDEEGGNSNALNTNTAAEEKSKPVTIEKIEEKPVSCDSIETAYDLVLITTSGQRIYFTTLDEFSLQAKRLQILLDEHFRGQVEGVKQIDLRFGNKIYYD